MYLNFKSITSTAAFGIFGALSAFGQGVNQGQLGGKTLNTITTAVPFLTISPDARAGGMGDLGVATSPDANSIHWNPAKLAFVEDELGFSISYTPWLRNLVPDISLAYLSFYKKVDDRQSFGAALRYFSLGDINFTDINGFPIGTFNPNEFSVDGAYARKLSEKFSTGIGLRFIYSNLAAGLDPNNATKPGTSFAGDVSFFYTDKIKVKDKNARINAGLNFSNLGAKISYTESGQANFLPANMRLGSGLIIELDKYNQLGINLEINKLLVPTNPVYLRDSLGNFVFDNEGNPIPERGEDPNSKGVIEGVFKSFSDAPDGFAEELREITMAIGLEYIYNKQFAIRGGFFHEDLSKGARQYITMGAGVMYNVFKIDFSYIIPTNRTGLAQASPLENTLRFSLQFDMKAFKKSTPAPPPAN